MTPELFEQMIRLQHALDIVTKIGQRRQMKSSDIQALVESLKHLTKKYRND
jgi:hypothetical protein